MEETIAQAAPNNGASNAADFQPPTQSPQTAPGSLQQQNGLQGNKNPQEFLNDNQSAQIKVLTQPAPAPAQVKSDVTGLVIIAVLASAIGLLLYKLSNKLPTNKADKKDAKTQSDAVLEAPSKSSPEEPEAPPSNPKQPRTKTKSKKSKRRNR